MSIKAGLDKLNRIKLAIAEKNAKVEECKFLLRRKVCRVLTLRYSVHERIRENRQCNKDAGRDSDLCTCKFLRLLELGTYVG